MNGTPRRATVGYLTATIDRPPALRVALKPDSSISERDWPAVLNAIQRVSGVIEAVATVDGRYVLVRATLAKAHWTDKGMTALSQAICNAADIQIEGPVSRLTEGHAPN